MSLSFTHINTGTKATRFHYIGGTILAAGLTLGALALNATPAQAGQSFNGFCSFQNGEYSETAQATMTVREQEYGFLSIYWHNDGATSSFDLNDENTLRDTDQRALWNVLEAQGNTVRIQRLTDGAVIACYSM